MLDFSSAVDKAMKDLDLKMFNDINGDKPFEHWTKKYPFIDPYKHPMSHMALKSMKQTQPAHMQTEKGWKQYQRKQAAIKGLETKEKKGLLDRNGKMIK